MSELTLVKTRLLAGVWEGELSGAGDETPKVSVTHEGQSLDNVQLTRDEPRNIWLVSISIPNQLISDGVQTFVIHDANKTVLNSFSLVAGDALAEDLRVEISLLRSELDMLKQSFRDHCRNS